MNAHSFQVEMTTTAAKGDNEGIRRDEADDGNKICAATICFKPYILLVLTYATTLEALPRLSGPPVMFRPFF